MSNIKNFRKLDTFKDETFVRLETTSFGAISNSSLESFIDLWWSNNSWEEIVNETKEDLSILDNNLWPVEISKTSHENNFLINIWFSSLETTSLSKYRLDSSETPIIMDLFGEERFSEIVQAHELLGKSIGCSETFRHEHVFANKNNVWNNHSTTSEQGFKVLWELGSTGITWVHCDEETDGESNTDLLFHKQEGAQSWVHFHGNDSIKDFLDLSSNDRQYINTDSVELIEATPGS
jgi:hypothetical protein